MNTASHFSQLFKIRLKIFKKGGPPHAKTQSYSEVVYFNKNLKPEQKILDAVGCYTPYTDVRKIILRNKINFMEVKNQ